MPDRPTRRPSNARLVACPAERSREAGALVKSLLHGEFGFEPDPALDADLEDPVTSYRAEGGELWVLIDETERLRGSCAVRRLSSRDAELKRMFIDPEMRGAGHGREMLEEAITFCRAQGFARLLLDSTRDLHAALGLYRSAGFVEIADYNGNPRADCWMALLIAVSH